LSSFGTIGFRAPSPTSLARIAAARASGDALRKIAEEAGVEFRLPAR
jgi:hypothetical protein